jgi:hypothetical protein
MKYEPIKLMARYIRTYKMESYRPSKAEIRKDTEEEKNIKGAVLFITIYLSIPALSQMGISTKPPPIATVAPSTPAIKPLNIPYRILSSDIFYF